MRTYNTENYIVWISGADRIASFRIVDGYEKMTFQCHDFFMNYLYGLQKSGYRFQ